MSGKRNRQQVEKWQSRVRGINKFYPFRNDDQVDIKRDDLERMHCKDGPAYISRTRVTCYKEGKKHGYDIDRFGSISYYFEGVQVPPRYVRDPESLTFQEIIQHPNTEVRYVGMKVYGLERMREENRFTVVHSDEYGNGRELLKFDGIFEEPVMLVKVFNGTPEPNGTYKKYYLQVPPTMKTCQEAVAWTFRKTENEYAPAQET